jgi:predicted DNA repair protein MutK
MLGANLSKHNNPVCLQAIARFNIAAMIPVGGHISFADVAQNTGLSEQIVARILRHAITMRVFHEPQPRVLGHTKTSRMLANSIVNDWLKVGTEEMWPAAVKVRGQCHYYPLWYQD